jgi:hypothetical protein
MEEKKKEIEDAAQKAKDAKDKVEELPPPQGSGDA